MIKTLWIWSISNFGCMGWRCSTSKVDAFTPTSNRLWNLKTSGPKPFRQCLFNICAWFYKQSKGDLQNKIEGASTMPFIIRHLSNKGFVLLGPKILWILKALDRWITLILWLLKCLSFRQHFVEMIQNDLSCQMFFNAILPMSSYKHVKIAHI